MLRAAFAILILVLATGAARSDPPRRCPAGFNRIHGVCLPVFRTERDHFHHRRFFERHRPPPAPMPYGGH